MYNGKSYSLVMPEVFTKENKAIHSSYERSGDKNGRAKLTSTDVLKIRKLYNEGVSRDEICKEYPNITRASINAVIRGKTWKSLK